MAQTWIHTEEQLPNDDQRVLAFIPGNKVFLPGKDLDFEIREVIVLRFCANHFAGQSRKSRKTRPPLLGRVKEAAIGISPRSPIGLPFQQGPSSHRDSEANASWTSAAPKQTFESQPNQRSPCAIVDLRVILRTHPLAWPLQFHVR